jgi:hypothetical protein
MEEPFEIEVTKIFNVPVSAWPPGPFQPGRPDRALQEGRPPEQVRLKIPTADGLVLKSTNTTDDLEAAPTRSWHACATTRISEG